MITIGNTLYAMNNGNVLFDLETFEFSCDVNFPPSIDLINVLTDSVIDTIEIPSKPALIHMYACQTV